MTELSLFIIVGAIAVVAAVMMLLSENAVYSALYLILTMGCVAFLFLLLNAPFLAMIQITVYAGAIMVLFIFVIMLLGAERTGGTVVRFRWQTPLAIGLAAAFLLIAGLAVANGGVDRQLPVAQQPLVRVLNLAADAGNLNVYAGDSPIATNVRYNTASDYVSLPSGEVNVAINPENGDARTGTFTFAPSTAQTLVIYGMDDNLTMSVLPADLNTVGEQDTRVQFFNAYAALEAVAVYDLGSNGQLDRGTGGITDRPLIEALKPGDLSAPITLDEGDVFWAFVGPNDQIVSRVVGPGVGRSYRLEGNTSQLITLAPYRSLIDQTLRPQTSILRDEARPAFGGPEAIGLDLFTRYILPFEMVSVLLLAAMVGAIVLTHKEEIMVRARDRAAMRRRVSRPLASVIAAQVGHDVTEPKGEKPALPAETRGPAGD